MEKKEKFDLTTFCLHRDTDKYHGRENIRDINFAQPMERLPDDLRNAKTRQQRNDYVTDLKSCEKTSQECCSCPTGRHVDPKISTKRYRSRTVFNHLKLEIPADSNDVLIKMVTCKQCRKISHSSNFSQPSSLQRNYL